MSSNRILIVDDDSLVLGYLRECVLDMMPEYAVDTASSPQQAQERIENFDYQIVLCDVEMPGMTGIELLKELKAQQLAPTFVFMTGNHHWLPMAVDAGGYSCIPKPIPIITLGTVLRQGIDFNTLRRRVDRLRQVLACQTRMTDEYYQQVQARITGLEKQMGEMRREELDGVIAAWASQSHVDLSLRV
jgi:DNA-binding NtrC family response regulator